VLKLKRGDYGLQGKRARLRLLEKGNKEKLVWLHHERSSISMPTSKQPQSTRPPSFILMKADQARTLALHNTMQALASEMQNRCRDLK